METNLLSPIQSANRKTTNPKQQQHYDSHSVRDPLTDIIKSAHSKVITAPHTFYYYSTWAIYTNNSKQTQINSIQLTNILAYLTQRRTYPFSTTHYDSKEVLTKSLGAITRATPLRAFCQRMRDKCEGRNNLLFKSLHNSYALRLQQQIAYNTTHNLVTNSEVSSEDKSARNLLKTNEAGGSSNCAVKKQQATEKVATDYFEDLRNIILLDLEGKTRIVEDLKAVAEYDVASASSEQQAEDGGIVAIVVDNKVKHMSQTIETIQTTETNVKTDEVDDIGLLSTISEEELIDESKINDIKMEQEVTSQQKQEEHRIMSTKASIAKMSLNLNSSGSTTADAAAGNVGKSCASTSRKTVLTPKTPKTPLEQSKIPTSAKSDCTRKDKAKGAAAASPSSAHNVSFDTKVKTPKTPPVTPDSPFTYIEDDMNSVYSFATTTSGRSTMSCEHPYVALNGTTFSGRKMKYVVHCSAHAGQSGPDYLTPTQRAQRQLRRLKEVLSQARNDLEQKDSEIVRLTREVVELRLFKASLSSPDERSASSDAITVREAELKTSQDVSPIVDMVDDVGATSKPASCSPRHLMHHATQQSPHSLMHSSTEMHSSCADSGNFEDMTSSSQHSVQTHDVACGSDELAAANEELAAARNVAENFEIQRQELIRMYEQKIEELIRSQDAASSDMKRVHNDKMEALLMKLADCNTRYADIVPDYEHAKERIRELEAQLEDLQIKLADHEEKQKKMYLHMYQKGQEAERIARTEQAMEMATRQPNSKVSVSELLLQLQNTQDELDNIRASEQCRVECGNNHALLTAKEAISLWVVGARKTIYKRLLEAQKNRTHVDPEVTLQFLKSAVYYFLTDKENSQGHLQAIESILEFTDAEKENISKSRVLK